jgi:transposase-like protein
MRTTETERRAYVEAFHRSGLRLIDFCRERGLNPKTFYTWRKRYVSDDDDEPAFLPLHIKEAEKPADRCVNSPRTLSFKTRKFCLEVALDTQQNAADFKLIVQTLQAVL